MACCLVAAATVANLQYCFASGILHWQGSFGNAYHTGLLVAAVVFPERAWVVQTSRNLKPDPETIVRKTNSKPETNVCKTAPDAVLHGLLRTVHRVGSDTEPQKKKQKNGNYN